MLDTYFIFLYGRTQDKKGVFFFASSGIIFSSAYKLNFHLSLKKDYTLY